MLFDLMVLGEALTQVFFENKVEVSARHATGWGGGPDPSTCSGQLLSFHSTYVHFCLQAIIKTQSYMYFVLENMGISNPIY